MLTIAGGIILAVIVLFALRVLFTFLFHGPEWSKGLREGFKGFKDGLKGVTEDKNK